MSSILSSLFRPDRLIGSKTFAPESLLDTLRIPISTDTVLDRVKSGTRLRVGFRLVSNPGYDVRIGSNENNIPVTLRIKASRDTSVAPVIVTPLSNTPKGQSFLAGPLADYSIVVRGLSTTPPSMIGVGGVPSRRAYFQLRRAVAHHRIPRRSSAPRCS